jgi:hypothetical protein
MPTTGRGAGFGAGFTTGLAAGGRGAAEVVTAGAAGFAAITGAELVSGGVDVAVRVAVEVAEADDVVDSAVLALVARGTTAALVDADIEPVADRISGGVLVGADVVLSATGRLARLSSIATPKTAAAAAAMATRTAVVDTTRNADMLLV